MRRRESDACRRGCGSPPCYYTDRHGGRRGAWKLNATAARAASGPTSTGPCTGAPDATSTLPSISTDPIREHRVEILTRGMDLRRPWSSTPTWIWPQRYGGRGLWMDVGCGSRGPSGLRGGEGFHSEGLEVTRRPGGGLPGRRFPAPRIQQSPPRGARASGGRYVSSSPSSMCSPHLPSPRRVFDRDPAGSSRREGSSCLRTGEIPGGWPHRPPGDGEDPWGMRTSGWEPGRWKPTDGGWDFPDRGADLHPLPRMGPVTRAGSACPSASPRIRMAKRLPPIAPEPASGCSRRWIAPHSHGVCAGGASQGSEGEPFTDLLVGTGFLLHDPPTPARRGSSHRIAAGGAISPASGSPHQRSRFRRGSPPGSP